MENPSTPIRKNTRKQKDYYYYNTSSFDNQNELSKLHDAKTDINYIKNKNIQISEDDDDIRIDNLLQDDNDDAIEFNSDISSITSHEKGKISIPLKLSFNENKLILAAPKTTLSYYTKFPFTNTNYTKWHGMIGGCTTLHQSMIPDVDTNADSYGYTTGFVRFGYKKENVKLYSHFELGLTPKVNLYKAIKIKHNTNIITSIQYNFDYSDGHKIQQKQEYYNIKKITNEPRFLMSIRHSFLNQTLHTDFTIGMGLYSLSILDSTDSFVAATYHHSKSNEMKELNDNDITASTNKSKSTLKIKFKECIQYTYQSINKSKFKLQYSLFNPINTWYIQLQSYHRHGTNSIASIGLRYVTNKGYYWLFSFYIGNNIHFSIPIFLPTTLHNSFSDYIVSILQIILYTKLPSLLNRILTITYKLSSHDYDFFGNNNAISKPQQNEVQYLIVNQKEKEIASYQQECMKRQANTIKKQQSKKNGLVIIQGLYGVLNDEDKCLDVTIPLQFYVNDDGDGGTLLLSSLSKSGIMGFYDVVGCNNDATSFNNGIVDTTNKRMNWISLFFTQKNKMEHSSNEKAEKVQLWIRYKTKNSTYEIYYNDTDEVCIPSTNAKLIE